MAATDIIVSIGANLVEFAKGMDQALQMAEGKGAKGKDPKKFGQGFADLLQAGVSGGLSGVVSMVGGLFGPWGVIISTFINVLMDGLTAAIEKAKMLRNLQYETGLSNSELSKLEVVSNSTGISLRSLSHAFYEFNKNMATAQIRGSEFNVAAQKLGLDMDKLKDRTLTAQDAIKALAMAHKAGTDDATLAYYGNIMLGQSFEQLLPLIKKGSADMNALNEVLFKNSDEATEAMATLSDNWSLLWQNIKNIAYESVAFCVRAMEYFSSFISRKIADFQSDPAEKARVLNKSEYGHSNKYKMEQAEKLIKESGMSPEDEKKFRDAMGKLLDEGGKKIGPGGFTEAQGASRIQQMGGGDILSALAFTPLERIAMATEETARNTAPGTTATTTETLTPTGTTIGR
jgi:hypothetical protein